MAVKTHWGKFLLEVSPKGLYAIRFPGHFPDLKSRPPTQTRHLARLKKFLSRYFKNPNQFTSNIPLDLTGYTPFQKKVYATLRKVAAGNTVSYGELAKRAGFLKAARAVGSAMKKNRLPIVIPCHRVVPSTGSIGYYSAGKVWKQRLLTHEAGGNAQARKSRGGA